MESFIRSVYLICSNSTGFDEKTRIFYKAPFFLVKICHILQSNRGLAASAPVLHIQSVTSQSIYFQQAHIQAHVYYMYTNTYKDAYENNFAQKHPLLK